MKMEEKKLVNTNKGKVIPSRYMQSQKGPIKATHANMTTSAGSNTQSNSTSKTGITAAGKSSSTQISRPTRASQPLASTPQKGVGTNSGISAVATRVAKPNFMTPNSILKQTSSVISSETSQLTRLNQKGSTPSNVLKQTGGHKSGATSTPADRQANQNLSLYFAGAKNMDFSVIGPMRSKFVNSCREDFDVHDLRADEQSELQQPLLDIDDNSHSFANALVEKSEKKKKKSEKPMDEETLDLLYGRYLQWVYLDARAEMSFHDQQHLALAQLTAMSKLVPRIREEREELERLYQQSQQKKKLQETISLLEDTLTPIVSAIDSVSSLHNSWARSLETARNTMETENVYLPENKEEYCDELRHALAESASLLTGILSLMDGQTDSLGETVRGMSELMSVVGEEIKVMEKCEVEIAQIARSAMDETVLRVQLMGSDDPRRRMQGGLKIMP